MKLQFDPNQTFQLDAVAAITDLFDGQPQGAPEYAVINVGAWGGLFGGQERTELGAGNRLLLATDKLLANTRAIQTRNDIEVADPTAPLEAWELFDGPANQARLCPHFSVEMETGTGKTYVYLRTIFELARRYSFQKCIIVVPSVAIREGVLKNIEITAEHFRALYNNLPFEHFVYDARKVNRLRQFATSNTLQILVINIDAFRKNFTGTEAEQKSNVIYKESDKLSGRQPIEFVQAARPIVIIDEPQSVDATDRAQEAIKALNPLCTLRYSATHRHPYNLVYRLDPVRAFELKLVKQIVVVMSQSCDLANDKIQDVVLAQVLDWAVACRALIQQGNTFARSRNFRRALVAGNIPSLSLLHKHERAPTLGWSIVDFHRLFVLPKPVVIAVAQAAGPRLRLRSPYREHLAQALARSFMRVGLPHDAQAFEREGEVEG